MTDDEEISQSPEVDPETAENPEATENQESTENQEVDTTTDDISADTTTDTAPKSVYDAIAEEIYVELDDDSLDLARISLWVEYNVAPLSILLYEPITEADIEENPLLKAILKAMYSCKYYTSLITKALESSVSSDGKSAAVLSLKDGTSSVTFQNRNEVAKSYRAMLNLAKQYVDDLVNAYKLQKAHPRQVIQVPPYPPELINFSRND
jgi:hypothetical protein